MKRRTILVLVAFAVAILASTAPARAQAPTQYTLGTYLRDVARGNYELAANRFNVPAADAQIALARVFPDPTLSGGVSQYDLQQTGNNQTGTYVTLTVPLQIALQRSRRIDFAEANAATVRAELDDFARTLRGRAAHAYIDALQAQLVVERKRRTLASLEELVDVSELRFRAGDIGEALVLQSRVEARQFEAEVASASGAARSREVEALGFLGRGAPPPGATVVLTGDLRKAAGRTFSADALVARALQTRPDVVAARRRVAAADRQISLARANRVPDIELQTTWQHYFPFGPPATGMAAADLLSFGVAVPVPFSRIWRGELDGAHAQRGTAAEAESAVMRAVEVEVRSAVVRYDAAAARVKVYETGVLSDAEAVLDRTLYNYRRGGATLVEVLVVQRTLNDVYLSFIDALAEAASALVDVEQAAAIWDIEL
jgi:cobalt-zinc-cadmium efflux system outer membrane protein